MLEIYIVGKQFQSKSYHEISQLYSITGKLGQAWEGYAQKGKLHFFLARKSASVQQPHSFSDFSRITIPG